MKKVLLALLTLLLVSCCTWMYSSTPLYETSRQWSNEINQHQKIKFRVVAPGVQNEDASWVIQKMTEILNNSRTFYCFLCHNLSKYEFAFENASENDYVLQDYYVPKEELEKKEDNVFTLAFTKCDVKSEDTDFNIDCLYSIWDNQTKTFYVKGRLGPYTNVTKGGIPSLMADHLVIALGLD